MCFPLTTRKHDVSAKKAESDAAQPGGVAKSGGGKRSQRPEPVQVLQCAGREQEPTSVFHRRQARIDAEARLDGVYVVRTSLDADALAAGEAVWAYKSLTRVERAFRNLKTGHLEVRPVYVYNEARVRAHVFLCMLSLHVLWHLRRKLAPLLFEDDHPGQARVRGASPVARAEPSGEAKRKAATGVTGDGLAASSLDTLLEHLSTMTLNEVVMPDQPNRPFTLLSEATPLQRRAFELLKVDPMHNVSISMTP